MNKTVRHVECACAVACSNRRREKTAGRSRELGSALHASRVLALSRRCGDRKQQLGSSVDANNQPSRLRYSANVADDDDDDALSCKFAAKFRYRRSRDRQPHRRRRSYRVGMRTCARSHVYTIRLSCKRLENSKTL